MIQTTEPVYDLGFSEAVHPLDPNVLTLINQLVDDYAWTECRSILGMLLLVSSRNKGARAETKGVLVLDLLIRNPTDFYLLREEDVWCGSDGTYGTTFH